MYPAIVPLYALLSDTLGVLGFDLSCRAAGPSLSFVTNKKQTQRSYRKYLLKHNTYSVAIMTDMYDEKKVPEFSLPPYQHEDHGSEVSNVLC